MPEIAPCLWFDGQAEEAVEFYLSIFPNSGIDSIARCGPAGPGPDGSVLTIAFHLDGRPFLALNGGPQFQFTEALSLMVPCRNQDEVDRYWHLLGADGEYVQCGWLKDRYGVSWQVVPTAALDMVSNPAGGNSQKMFEAMYQMQKLDLAALQQAYES